MNDITMFTDDWYKVAMEQSMVIAADLDVEMDMVDAIAAYHDTGLTEDRKTHHIDMKRFGWNPMVSCDV